MLIRSSQEFTAKNTSTKEALRGLLYQKRPNGAPFNLYNKKIFEDICFQFGFLYEDMATTHRTYIKAKTICRVDSKIYAYCVRQDSIVRQKYTEEKRNDSINITRQLFDEISDYDISLKSAAASRAFA